MLQPAPVVLVLVKKYLAQRSSTDGNPLNPGSIWGGRPPVGAQC